MQLCQSLTNCQLSLDLMNGFNYALMCKPIKERYKLFYNFDVMTKLYVKLRLCKDSCHPGMDLRRSGVAGYVSKKVNKTYNAPYVARSYS